MQAWRARLASVSRNARNELRWMVEEVAPGASLRNLSAQQTARLEAMVADRVERRKPLQYVLGTWPFLDLNLVCREPILIPRPETEEWCATLSARLRERSRTSSLTIVDVCTGSGCVALALAKALDGARVVGVDDNPAAVALARENAARNGIERIEFVCADAVDFLRAQTPRSVAVVCGNPPYVSTDEWPTLQPEVRLWEDPHALVADDAGTALLRRLIEAAASVLRPPDAGATGPRLALEIGGAKQAKSLRAAARHAGFDASEVWLDYRKRARVFAAV